MSTLLKRCVEKTELKDFTQAEQSMQVTGNMCFTGGPTC